MQRLLLIAGYVGVIVSVDTELPPNVGSCFNLRDKVLTKNDRVVALRIPQTAYGLNMTFPLKIADLLPNNAELYDKFSLFGAVEIIGRMATVDFRAGLQKYLGVDLTMAYARQVRVIKESVAKEVYRFEK